MSVSTDDRSGVLPAQALSRLADSGAIQTDRLRLPDSSVQPASVDLRLGGFAYRLRCSFLPERTAVADKLDDIAMEEIDLRAGAILERNRPYLIPLKEELHLPQHLRARANPRSSTGRLDIFTRVISDHSHQFDEIAPGYSGPLFLEVVSRSFTIKIKEGMSLNQLRVIDGYSRCSDEEIRLEHEKSPLLYIGDHPAPSLHVSNGLFLSLDLAYHGENAHVGYRAKKNSKLLDLSMTRHYEPREFWDPVFPEPKGRIILEPEEFYLLISREAISIDPRFAAEMVAYDPTSGELRTHYAGFFDPGFGWGWGRRGTRAVLELRAHDVPFMVENAQRVCKFSFERMQERPDRIYGQDIGSSYADQVLTLSKHFRTRKLDDRGEASSSPQQSFFTFDDAAPEQGPAQVR